MDERALFQEALSRPKAERGAFLARACAGKSALRKAVEALLAAHEARAGASAKQGARDGDTAASAHGLGGEPAGAKGPGSSFEPGGVIADRYTLVERLGEGGMGEVWVARQTEPVKRKVALKLIKAGMDSKQVLARFDAERQALALMDHPNIATVLDGGLHEHRPFFVMELVKGVPITEFCDRQKMPPRQRLELFVQACQAIQHAHQKGIIHRDIKPGNVLVATYDDRPVVKVIDFGVAKATGGALTEATIDTGFGGMVGTPQYMSPEQATFDSLDIDTRSDVYSLGVLLYELLAGSPPFAGEELKKRGLLELLRVVREEEPPRPSTKLSTAAGLADLSASRGTEPQTLAGLLRNELDWIVMKALEKDRTRRYETANGFAADVQRYLAGEPVDVHPPSAGYRLRKFVRRHRAQVAAAGLTLTALLSGIAVSVWQMMLANEAHAAEVVQRGIAEHNADEARRQERQARDMLALANSLTDFLRHDLLGQAGGINQANRLFAPKPDLTVREALDRAAATVEAKFGDRPVMEASIRSTLGETFLQVGEPHEAVKQIARALELAEREFGRTHEITVANLRLLGQAYLAVGRARDAVPLFGEVRDHAFRQHGAASEPGHTAVGDLALALTSAGQARQAIALLEPLRDELLATKGPADEATLHVLQRLAAAYEHDRQYGAAVAAFEQARDGYARIRSADHPDTLLLLNNLAGAMSSVGRKEASLALQEDLAKRSLASLGAEHPNTLMARHNLAHSYLEGGRSAEAVPILEDLRAVVGKKLGQDHPATLMVLHNLAKGYLAEERLDEAIDLLERVRTGRLATFGATHPDTLKRLNHLGLFCWMAKRFGRGAAAFAEVVAGSRVTFGDGDEYTICAAFNQAFNLRDDQQLAAAADVFAEWLPRAMAIEMVDQGMFREALRSAIDLNLRTGQEPRNAHLLPRHAAEQRKHPDPDAMKQAGSLGTTGRAMLRVGLFAAAEDVLRETLRIREANAPDSCLVCNTRSLLGGALLGQGKAADAEPLLREGLAGMQQRAATMPKTGGAELRIPEAIERLIELCTTTNRPDEAATWRAERAKYPAAPQAPK